MVWVQVLALPQASVANQMRVATKVAPQVRLVTVLLVVIVTVPQVSLAKGVPKISAAPHSLVWLAGQEVKVGLVVSTVAMVWVQVLALPQASVANQMRVATKVAPQVRLVAVRVG